MKRILILGSTGMLGSEVLKVFAKEKNFIVTATYNNKNSLNKLKKNFTPSLINKIKFIKFDVINYSNKSIKKLLGNNCDIINCVGVIKPYIDEKNKKSKNALLVNSIFPHNLNEVNNSNKNATIYQIATDCVFSGSKGSYLESSEHDPLDIYGKTKSLGEVNDKSFFNLRCSIIGNEIKNYKSLFEWFKIQNNGTHINGFSNHLWNGLTTNVFAKLIKAIILENISIPNTLHIVPRNKVSKFQLLKLFKKKMNKSDIFIKRVKANIPVNRTIDTIFKNKNLQIWKKSDFKKQLTISEIVINTL